MRRYLVVANQTVGGQPLADKVTQLMAAGACQFHIVVPATHTAEHLTWTEGEAITVARRNLEEGLARLRARGASVTGEVGDSRPVDAVGDAIRAGPPVDAIIVSTLPPGLSRWLRQDLPRRLARAYGRPVIQVAQEVAASH